MGSSIVMMCSSRVSLISSIMAASVVDLPEPVGPVTMTKPRGLRVSSCSAGGRPSSSRVLICDGDEAEGRAQRVALEVGVDAEARAAGHRVGEVDLPLVLQPLPLVLAEDRVDQLAGVVGRQARVVEALELPLTRMMGGDPTVRCRSLASRSRTSRRTSTRSIVTSSIGGCDPHQMITRAISSMEVIPCSTLSMPSSRRLFMPSALATREISSALLRSTVSRRMASLTIITSYRPSRPL